MKSWAIEESTRTVVESKCVELPATHDLYLTDAEKPSEERSEKREQGKEGQDAEASSILKHQIGAPPSQLFLPQAPTQSMKNVRGSKLWFSRFL